MRKSGSNGERLDNLEKQVKGFENQYVTKKEFQQHIEIHVKDDLIKPRFVGSDKPLYTYEDIADKYDISKSSVQKIAEENGLNRRKGKNVG
jgi:hypothetical protein